MKLVENAKESWRWISMQAMTLAGAIQGAWMMVPDDMKVTVPKNIVHWATIVLLVTGVIGRLVKQNATKP